MALLHTLEKVSIGNDGKSILLVDKTVYGAEGNPRRDEVAWLVAAVRHDGEAETAVTEPIGYLHNPTAADPPYYASTDMFQATHLLVPLDEDGLYTVQSVLLWRKSSLSDTAGFSVINELVVDDYSGAIEQVIGASMTPEGLYNYAFGPATFAQAVHKGYPSVFYPVLQLVNSECQLGRASYGYLDTLTAPSCGNGTTPVRSGACFPGTPVFEQRSKLYHRLALVLDGTENSFMDGHHEHTLAGLRQAAKTLLKLNGDD